MAWSDYDDHPIQQDMVDARSNNAIDRHISELDFRYEDNHSEIEAVINEEYPSPEQAPDLPPSTLAELAGRELEKKVSKVREFYTAFDGTNDISDQDYQRTLEYLGLRALKNGNSN